MIIDLIVQIVLGLLTGVLALIPAYSMPDLSGFGGTLGTNIGALNSYFPVITLGVCLLAIVGARLMVFGFDMAIKIYELIPLKFT